MKHCPHCHIEVGGPGRYFPLCHTPLAGGDDGEAPYFPPSPPPGQRMPLAMKLVLFVLLAAVVVCVAVDFLILEPGETGGRLHWSLAVAVCAAAALLLCRALLLGSRNAPKLLFQILIGTALVAYFLDRFLGLGGVSFLYVIPILCSVTLALNFIFAFINRRFTENGLVYLLLNIAVGVTPYIALTVMRARTPLTWVICLIVSVITFLGLVIFKGRALRAELEKRLHL